MAKKAAKKTARASSTSTRAKKKSKSNVEILIEKGALDAGAAARLDKAVAQKINKYTKRDMTFLIKHQLVVCGKARPAPDGSFF